MEESRSGVRLVFDDPGEVGRIVDDEGYEIDKVIDAQVRVGPPNWERLWVLRPAAD